MGTSIIDIECILFYSILFYPDAFYLECILTRNERRDEKGCPGIDSHLRGDHNKSTYLKRERRYGVMYY